MRTPPFCVLHTEFTQTLTMSQLRISEFVASHRNSMGISPSNSPSSPRRMPSPSGSQASAHMSTDKDDLGQGTHVEPAILHTDSNTVAETLTSQSDGSTPSPNILMEIMSQQQKLFAQMTMFLPKQPASNTGNTQPLTTDSQARAADQGEPEAQEEGELHEELDNSEDTFGDYVNPPIDIVMGETDEPDVYEEITAFFGKDDKLGPPVSEATAKLIASAMRAPVGIAKEKELIDKILRPENAEFLQVPKTNPEVWQQLQKATRDADVGLQHIQHMVHKSVTYIVLVMDAMREKKQTEHLRALADAFRLLALTSAHVSQKRKANIATDFQAIILKRSDYLHIQTNLDCA